MLTRENQHIKEINRHFDGTPNHIRILLITVNQYQTESYKFKDMLLQPEKLYFIPDIIKEVEAHESRSHG